MSSSCDCSYDSGEDGPRVCDERLVIARKQYKCIECGTAIAIGERYEYVRGLWDYSWSTFRTCIPCRTVRDYYCPGGFEYGHLATHIWDCLGFDYREVPEDDED